MRKITSGNQVCLEFNLVRLDPSSDEVLHQALISSKVGEAETSLQPWLEEVRKGKLNVFGRKLAIPLEHKYTEKNLSFARLKEDDRIVAEVMKTCSDKNGERLLDLKPGLVTKYQHGNYVEIEEHERYRFDSDSDSDSVDDPNDPKDHTMHDVQEETIYIKSWIGEDDRDIISLQNLPMGMKEIVVGEGEEPFHAEPDEAKYQRYKHDSGSTLEHFYHRAMLFVWP